ncbi:MAG: hypothetical protein ABIK86_08265 [candidate division WOR-3 bacterium]
MAKRIDLTLMVGPAIPVPVSREVLDALAEVRVRSAAGEVGVFQLTFDVSLRSPLHTLFLLSGGASVPLLRVIIVASVKGTTEVLMDGVMTNHELTPGGSAGPGRLTITGEDLTRVMDYIDFSGIPYPAMPVEARVALVLAKYAGFGIVPLIIPPIFTDVPLPTERIPRQKGKDLGYIKMLAEEAGYVFHIEPGPKPGMNIAYWGPDVKVGLPQPALTMNMDAYTNVESMNFNLDTEHKTQYFVYIQEPITKAAIPIPVPDVSVLNPPLGVVPLLGKKLEPLADTAKRSPLAAVMTGLAKASRTSDALTASGSLDVLRYGHVLKARRLVGVRGAGPAFDGLYYVQSVTHNIRRGEYKQDFKLTRNALVSTLARVPV